MSRTDPHLADLEQQIAETREALGQTVEELAAKVDVPTRAKAKAQDTAARLRSSAAKAEDRARERASDARNRTRGTASHAADRVRHSADAAKSHLPGGSGTDALPPPDSGSHRAAVAGPAAPSRPYVPVAVTLAAAAVIARTWVRRRADAS
jgi:cell division septum initiation protein DivIVA